MDTKQFAGHTPGPWKLEGEWSVGSKNIGGWISSGAFVFVLEPISGEPESIIAQARLFAAAPSLLAEVDRLQAREKVLADALRYYASDEAWTFKQTEGPDGDYGTRARAALETTMPKEVYEAMDAALRASVKVVPAPSPAVTGRKPTHEIIADLSETWPPTVDGKITVDLLHLQDVLEGRSYSEPFIRDAAWDEYAAIERTKTDGEKT